MKELRRLAVIVLTTSFAGGFLTAGPAAALDPLRLAIDARAQVGVTTGYDPAYRRLPYPGGDVPKETGVCTDVLVRAFRRQGFDLQQEVHEDMRAHFGCYPRRWGLSRPDPNIDHRRVPNLATFFQRRGWELPRTGTAEAWQPGDIVAWDLGRGVPHIGILSNRLAPTGHPLVIHNIGGGVQEEDVLFAYKIIGHFRIPGPNSSRNISSR